MLKLAYDHESTGRRGYFRQQSHLQQDRSVHHATANAQHARRCSGSKTGRHERENSFLRQTQIAGLNSKLGRGTIENIIKTYQKRNFECFACPERFEDVNCRQQTDEAHRDHECAAQQPKHVTAFVHAHVTQIALATTAHECDAK